MLRRLWPIDKPVTGTVFVMVPGEAELKVTRVFVLVRAVIIWALAAPVETRATAKVARRRVSPFTIVNSSGE